MLKKIFSLSVAITISHSSIAMEKSAALEKSPDKKVLRTSHDRTLKKRSSSSSSSSLTTQIARLSPIKPRFFRKTIKEESFSAARTIDHSVMPAKEYINQADHNGDTNLIYAARNKMDDRVALLLQENLDINVQNRWSMTALHYAAINKDKKIIDLLLQDPRTQASINNKEGYTARELVDVVDEHKEDIKLRNSLFVRVSLEKIIETLCASIQSTSHDAWKNKTITGDSECIEKAMKEIEDVFFRDKEIQETHQPLPEEALLPDYVDNNFMRTMLMLRLYGTN